MFNTIIPPSFTPALPPPPPPPQLMREPLYIHPNTPINPPPSYPQETPPHFDDPLLNEFAYGRKKWKEVEQELRRRNILNDKKDFYCGSNSMTNVVDAEIETCDYDRSTLIANQKTYTASLFGTPRTIVPETLYCKVQKCIYDHFQAWSSYRLLCKETSEKKASTPEKGSTIIKFPSRIMDLTWSLLIRLKEYSAFNRVNPSVDEDDAKQIGEMFEEVVRRCEEKEFKEEERSCNLCLLYSGLGVIALWGVKRAHDFMTFRKKQKNDDDLLAAVDEH